MLHYGMANLSIQQNNIDPHQNLVQNVIVKITFYNTQFFLMV